MFFNWAEVLTDQVVVVLLIAIDNDISMMPLSDKITHLLDAVSVKVEVPYIVSDGDVLEE